MVYILCRYCYNSFCRSHFSLYSILNPDLHDAVRWRTALCHDKNEDVERWMRLRARPYARIRQSSCEKRNKRVFLFFFFVLSTRFSFSPAALFSFYRWRNNARSPKQTTRLSFYNFLSITIDLCYDQIKYRKRLGWFLSRESIVSCMAIWKKLERKLNVVHHLDG